MLNGKILNHRNIYLLSLILIAFWQPLSVFLTSASAIMLAVNWVVEGKFLLKWKRFVSRPGLVVFSFFIFIPAIWLLNSSDLSYGLYDLKIKIPVFGSFIYT